MASAASSRVAKPSGAADMKPTMRSTPAASSWVAMSTSTRARSRPGRSVPSLISPTMPPMEAPTSTGGRPISAHTASRSSTMALVV